MEAFHPFLIESGVRAVPQPPGVFQNHTVIKLAFSSTRLA
jgi:hypothetical protein